MKKEGNPSKLSSSGDHDLYLSLWAPGYVACTKIDIETSGTPFSAWSASLNPYRLIWLYARYHMP